MADDVTRVWVGACGKHPGWDDHIADQGLETEFLVRVRRLLYVEGIGGNIDAGSWEELSAEDRSPGFDHVFLWRAPDGLMIGRMWSSSDGKGRTRYPMIVCAQTRGLSCDWVVGPCLARLEQLAEQCRQSSSAGAVITAVDEARADLRRQSASAPEASRQPLPPPAALATIADGCAVGREQDALVRVVYQLEREFSSFLMLEDGSDTRSRTVDVRPRHMRVPACESDMAHACALWLRFLLERVDAVAPILLFGRVGAGHVDVVVGEPGRAQVFHLQASAKRTPLTTAIPYNIDAEFRARVESRVAGARSGAIRDFDPGRVSDEAPRRRAPAKKSKGGSKPPAWAIAGGAVVVLAVLVWLAMSMLGRGGQQSQSEPPKPEVAREEPKPAGQPVTPIKVGDGDVETFQRWCLAYDGWLGKLVTDARRSALFSSDAYLSSGVLEPIRAAMSSGLPLDPNVVVANPAASARELARSVPPDAGTPEVAAAARAAMGLADRIEAALRGWPARVELAGTAEQLATWKIDAAARELSSAATGALPTDGGDVVGGCERVAALAQLGLPSTLKALGEAFSTLSALEAVGDPKLAEAAGQVRAEMVGSLSGLSPKQLADRPDVLDRMVDLRRTLDAAKAHWDEVDADLFRSKASVYVGDAAGEKGWDLLQSWREEVGQPGFAKLDPANDPRVAASLESVAAQLTAKARELGAKAQADATERAAAVGQAVAELSESVRALESMPWNGFTEKQVFRETERLRNQAGQLQSSLDTLAMEVEEDLGSRVADLRSRNARFDSDALNQTWLRGRDALAARLDTNGDAVGFLRSALSLEKQLRSLDEASQVTDLVASVPEQFDERAVRELVRQRRAQIVADGLPAGAPEAWTDATVASAAQAVRDELAAFAKGVDASLSELHAVSTALHERYGLNEALEEGLTLRAAWEKVQARMGAQAVAQVAPELERTIEALEKLEAARADASAVMALADAESDPGVAWQAWLALGQAPGWPSGAEQLRQDLHLLSEARSGLSDVGDAGRRAALVQKAGDESARRWKMAVERAPSWAELGSCVQMQESAGGDIAALSASRQLAVAVLLARPTIAPAKEDGRNQELADGLVRRATELGLGSEKDWATLLEGLRALAAEDPSAVPPLDPSAVGPARVGWGVEASDDGETLVYRLPGQAGAALTFRLVTMDDGRSSFVCTDELSIGVLLALTRADASLTRDLVTLLGWPEPRAMQLEPPGMYVWKWSGTEQSPQLGLADAWFPQWCTPAGAFVSPDATSTPSEAHPVQRISWEAALFIAGRLGCRPLTLDEWRAAYRQTGNTALDAGWNLRDSVVSQQIEHLKSDRFAGSQMRLPDTASFSGVEMQIQSYPFDDGRLWLSKAGEGPDEPFRHIIGNVLEFVLLELPDESRAELGEAVRSGQWSVAQCREIARSLSPAVVGGSLFSAADAGVDRAASVDSRRRTWTDVGVRLAFSSDEGRVRRSIGSRLSSLLETAVLPPGEGTR